MIQFEEGLTCVSVPGGLKVCIGLLKYSGGILLVYDGRGIIKKSDRRSGSC